jgi:type I restriction enzyme M protein
MAVKKSDLYASLWKSCDKLRGGMDASQYKDYVLVLLFMKYVSDRSANGKDSLLDIPDGGSFAALVALKGKSDIGDGINKVIGKLADANELRGVIDVADFNDDSKLGKGKEMVDRLSDLIAIFEDPALNFSGNSAEGDDLLGDAYEYLMRNFATESGKSKGQFYTPAEVSRTMAAVIGITKAKSQQETIYDPACGSASLLLKAHDAAKSATGFDLAIYGQEMDNATAALARMNMWLHNAAGAEIENNNTLSTPMFKDPKTGKLKTFDYVVANPPFSTKDWTLGVNVSADPYERFAYGTPPEKNGDYAFLLHILASIKSTGKGAVILPHGVLFRGNAEATIRRNIVKQGYVKGIIGLPPNLFYGTGIPACIIVLDKESAARRDAIFMIDASKGYIKDGAKNRLRERDIHRIVDTFTTQTEIDKYSRLVPIAEIADPKNDYNLNLTRYIDTREPEDLQDLDAHFNGGIPNRDIDALDTYWATFPTLRATLFAPAGRSGYSNLRIPSADVSAAIRTSPELAALSAAVHDCLDTWRGNARPVMAMLDRQTRPKVFITELAEDLLAAFRDTPLIDEYAIYQSLMEFWSTTMQDDTYLIAGVGWQAAAKPVRLEAKSKDRADFTVERAKFKSELIPSELLIARFFASDYDAVQQAEAAVARQVQALDDLCEEHGGDEGLLVDLFGEKTRIPRKDVVARLREKGLDDGEKRALVAYLAVLDAEANAKQSLKAAEERLNAKVSAKYGELTEEEVQALVIDEKWIDHVIFASDAELRRLASTLSGRIKELAARYADTLPALVTTAAAKAQAVSNHLNRMGVTW